MSNTAIPVGYDLTTQGSWVGVYGADGYSLAQDTTSNPSYVTPVVTGPPFTFADPSSDVRALQKASNHSVRLSAVWFSGTAVIFDLNLSAGGPYRVGIYLFDGDNGGRVEQVQVIDGVLSTVFDTRNISSFYATPIYLFWDCTGHVKIKITPTIGANSVANAIFFQPTSTTGAIVPFSSSNPTPGPVCAVLPAGTVGTAYSQTITSQGGTGPYTYSVTSGSLPSGLSLSSGGVISGTPSAAGTSTATIQALDTLSSPGTQVFSLTINGPSVRIYGGAS